MWQGEQPYKVTEEEVKEEVEKTAKATGGFILNRGRTFWERFIKDGELDKQAVVKAKYRAVQLPFIESEMKRLGWL